MLNHSNLINFFLQHPVYNIYFLDSHSQYYSQSGYCDVIGKTFVFELTNSSLAMEVTTENKSVKPTMASLLEFLRKISVLQAATRNTIVICKVVDRMEL